MNQTIQDINSELRNFLYKNLSENHFYTVGEVVNLCIIQGYSESDVRNAVAILISKKIIIILESSLLVPGPKNTEFLVNKGNLELLKVNL